MNSGKVRIYELSRELELDNKDILVLCEQQNVAAKSHSSTITDDEANRVRTAAATYNARQDAPKKPVVDSKKGLNVKTKGADKSPVRKQQILEIRRSQPLTAPTPPKPAPATDTPPVRATADSDSVTPKVSRPEAKQNLPTRPTLQKPPQANESKAPHPAAPETLVEADVVLPTTLDDAAPELIESPEIVAVEAPAAVKLELVSKPRVSQPPQATVSQASPSTPAGSERKPIKIVSKPTPKRAEGRGQGIIEVRPADRSAVAPPGRPRPAEEAGTTDGAARPARPSRSPVPELKGPPRPRRASDPEEVKKEALNPMAAGDGPPELDEMGELLEKPTLRRPAPPKASKRPTWEEDDEQERPVSKVGKAAAKTKRRSSQSLLEDEDDLVDLDDDGNPTAGSEVSQMSLSLARPPKPKSQQKTQTPKPAATTQKPKRSTGPKDDSRQNNRRERIDPKTLRPEMIVLTTGLTVHELAEMMKVPETDLIKALFFKGIAANINQTLDIPTATMVAEEFEILVETAEEEKAARKVTEMLDAKDLDYLVRRPPVITIMGHVDHGKTTLLDSIRKTKVAQGEAGGITQHIGAYHVDIGAEGEEKRIVFLDTPGHEAFTAMRARGTRVTDIAILVVAADDGVRPQTIEAISHARAAKVPIVVAINKIDKEGAQPDRVKQELMEHNLVPEEWGGDTIMVALSAIKGENLDELLEMLALVAEVEDLKANPDRAARGTIIEANLDKARGPVATLLVQNGTLRVGDSFVAGSVFGKVRAMIDDRGRRVSEAPPSSAVEVLGLNEVPAAGDEFEVYPDEREARSVADTRSIDQRQSRLQQAMASRRVTLNTLSAQAQEGDLKELNLILKADVQGSVEAILGALQQLPQNEVQIRVLLAAPGEVTETDVDLAAASSAVIVGFNTTLASGSRRAADEAGVDVREYDIIYQLLEDIQGAMEGLLDPEMVEEPLGQVEVRAVFPVGRGAVAGCYVQSGKAVRNCRIRVRRSNAIVHEGNLDSLKRMKDDVKEANAGFECGIGLDKFSDWKEGDIIETFRLVSKRRTLAMT